MNVLTKILEKVSFRGSETPISVSMIHYNDFLNRNMRNHQKNEISKKKIHFQKIDGFFIPDTKYHEKSIYSCFSS